MPIYWKKDAGILWTVGGIAFHEDCCCEDAPDEACCGFTELTVPATLTGTVSVKVGTASVIPNTVTLTWNGAGEWVSADVLGTCEFRVNCVNQNPSLPDTEIQWYLANTGCWSNNYRVSVDCDPLTVVFNVTVTGGSFTLTVTL